jgi:hypothetical protein
LPQLCRRLSSGWFAQKKKVLFLARLAEVLSHGKHSEQDSAWVRSDTVFRRRGSLGMIG